MSRGVERRLIELHGDPDGDPVVAARIARDRRELADADATHRAILDAVRGRSLNAAYTGLMNALAQIVAEHNLDPVGAREHFDQAIDVYRRR